MRKIAVIFSAILVISMGCASAQPNLSPAQRLFALQAEYNVLQGMAADYCERPDADSEAKQAIKRIDDGVFQVFVKIRLGMTTAREAIPKIEAAIRAISEQISSVTERRII